jgi:predicted nucleic acid-binding protein
MPDQAVGLETSVVLRILTGDHEEQARATHELIRTSIHQGKRIVVSDLVVSEAYFALVAHYGVSKR